VIPNNLRVFFGKYPPRAHRAGLFCCKNASKEKRLTIKPLPPETASFKPRFCAVGGGCEFPCLRPDAGGASWGTNPPERAAKSQGLNTALTFFGYFFVSRQKSNKAQHHAKHQADHRAGLFCCKNVNGKTKTQNSPFWQAFRTNTPNH
jgi:hypothetical protein